MVAVIAIFIYKRWQAGDDLTGLLVALGIVTIIHVMDEIEKEKGEQSHPL